MTQDPCKLHIVITAAKKEENMPRKTIKEKCSKEEWNTSNLSTSTGLFDISSNSSKKPEGDLDVSEVYFPNNSNGDGDLPGADCSPATLPITEVYESKPQQEPPVKTKSKARKKDLIAPKHPGSNTSGSSSMKGDLSGFLEGLSISSSEGGPRTRSEARRRRVFGTLSPVLQEVEENEKDGEGVEKPPTAVRKQPSGASSKTSSTKAGKTTKEREGQTGKGEGVAGGGAVREARGRRKGEGTGRRSLVMHIALDVVNGGEVRGVSVGEALPPDLPIPPPQRTLLKDHVRNRHGSKGGTKKNTENRKETKSGEHGKASKKKGRRNMRNTTSSSGESCHCTLESETSSCDCSDCNASCSLCTCCISSSDSCSCSNHSFSTSCSCSSCASPQSSPVRNKSARKQKKHIFK